MASKAEREYHEFNEMMEEYERSKNYTPDSVLDDLGITDEADREYYRTHPDDIYDQYLSDGTIWNPTVGWDGEDIEEED